MHQQRGVHVFRAGGGDEVEFFVELLEEGVEVARVADHDADLVLHVDRLGKGAQVEADNGLFDPLTGGGNDFFVTHGAGFPGISFEGRHFALIMAGFH